MTDQTNPLNDAAGGVRSTPEPRIAPWEPDCMTCGQPANKHSGGYPNTCPIIATYKPRSIASLPPVEPADGGEAYSVSGDVYESAVKGRQDFRRMYRETLARLLRAFEPDEKETAAINALAEAKDMSAQGIMRQALRHYQLVCHRLDAGETLSFSGDAARAAEFAGLTTPEPLPAGLEERALAEPPMTVKERVHQLLGEEIDREDISALHPNATRGKKWEERSLSIALRALERALSSPVAEIDGLICALGEAAFTFETYAKMHSAKGTSEGHEKAAKNAKMAERCRDAIALASLSGLNEEEGR